MACRDYEYDYENWLSRTQERLTALTSMARELRAAFAPRGLEVPRAVLEGLTASTSEPLTKELFDGATQLLCLMCRTAEEHALALPASVQAWWAQHKVRDEHAELARGLSPTPIYSDFWQEHAAKRELLAEFPDVSHRDAVKALEAAGCRVVNQGRYIAMEKDGDRFLVPRHDPVNPFAMAAIVRRVGLTDGQFRELLHGIAR